MKPIEHHTLYNFGGEMFSSISGRIKNAFNIRAKKFGKDEVIKSLAEVRQVLLDADVARNSVESFISKIQNEVMEKYFVYDKRMLRQADAVKIYRTVQNELEKLVGGDGKLTEGIISERVMMMGVQGSGKTTSAAKIALRLRMEGKRVLLVPLDIVRPAAIEQLIALGEKVKVDVIKPSNMEKPELNDILEQAEAQYENYDSIIFDTAGRMHVDNELMTELQELNKRLDPTEKMLVVDGNTGQDAINTATEFTSKLKLTGVMLTRMDSDTKGGVAISMRSTTSVPIKFIGVGEDMDEIERFVPEVIVKRILGESTISHTLQEMEEKIDPKRHDELMKKKVFMYYDYIHILEQMVNSGSSKVIREISQYLPKAPNSQEVDMLVKKYKKQHSTAIRVVDFMTQEEKENPILLRRMASRRKTLASRAGVAITDVSAMIKDFEEVKEFHRQQRLDGSIEKNTKTRPKLNPKAFINEFKNMMSGPPPNMRQRRGRRF
eukprot:CAMPEP_0117425322 /NCGR_PEP_ID=MMETSP0758-20121206/5603_1 /TAXON_ID=63605 /ORGANISM="Percolomonas cosmopolitus, Strain AE-1 (ATCC 50343)" /LENGTH=491 /DNA_ID=CAMNT_0005209709 /DNA_START=191 /DNA_END=1669 /DNA_ORIENTATION=+